MVDAVALRWALGYFFGNFARYSIRRLDQAVIALVDEFDPAQPTRTLTNDAELVIADINQLMTGGIGDRVVVYRDTEGRWDEIVTREGKFIDFAPGGPTLEAAVEAAAKRRGGGQP